MGGIIDLVQSIGDVYFISEWTIKKITLWLVSVGFLISVIKFVWNCIHKVIFLRNRRILNRDLHPYYSRSDVDRATRYYVPTKYQNVAPSEDEEPGRKYIASAKNELIPLFLKQAFHNDNDDNEKLSCIIT